MQVMDRSMDTSHRIPSSVFELDHSSDPIQWSTASSESLFSIHLGNTSISGDYGLRCSDECGTRGEASIDRPVPTRQVSDRPSVKLRAVEASLEEEGSRESEDHNHEKSFAEGRGSNASVKSFAFPILAGEDSTGKLGCSARFPEPKQAPSPTQEIEPSPQSEPEAAQKKWFSCFPCCP
nr:Glutamate--tRNA ligase [Ipomoea batatas]